MGGRVILTSADGLIWTAQTPGNLYAVTWAGSQEDLYGVAWTRDHWIAVGANATRIIILRT